MTLLRRLPLRAALLLAAGVPACGGHTAPDSGTGADIVAADAALDVAPASDAIDVIAPSDMVAPTDAVDVAPPLDTPVQPDVPATDVPPPPPGSAIVAQWHGDLQRTGANRNETLLSQAAVMGGRFHRDTGFAPTFDDVIYAQPLYLPRQMIMGAMHDVLYVATLNNSVYAVDALTGMQLWRVNLGTPVPRSTQPCGNVGGHTGILGTPVIDPATGTLYAVSATAAGGPSFSINALDVTTGQPRTGYPAVIRPPTSNGSSWDPYTQQQRAASVFVGGKVYVPFGGLWGDCRVYHGWVVAIDAGTPATQTAFATAGNQSGIWAPGGISGDGAGHLFAVTGNGMTAQSMGDYVFRFNTTGAMWSGTTADYFRPSDFATLDPADLDLGTVNAIVLPDHVGSSTPHLLFTAGKTGVAYLINRDNLGGLGHGDGTTGEGVYSDQLFGGGTWGGGAAWSNGTDVFAFMSGHGTQAGACNGSGGVVAVRLTLTGGASSFAIAFCASSGDTAAPIVTSNGNQDGVLWVVDRGPSLRAYALPSGTMLYRSTGADVPPSAQHWTPPIAADGRVYVTGTNGVALYRLM